MGRTTRRIGDLIEPVCALFALVIGALAVTGWLTGQPRLASMVEGLPPAKVNGALAYVLLAAALLLRAGSHDRRRAAVGTGLAIAAGCIGLATFAEYATGVNLGIDELIVVDHSGVGRDPGRMAALVTVAISLIAGSIVLHGRAGSAGLLRWLLALGAFTAGYLSLLGLSFGALQLSTVFGFGPEIALPAALSVLALGLAGLACYHTPSPTSILLSSTPGALIARVVLVAGVVGVPAVGWFSRLGEDTGLFTREFGAVIMVATSGIVVAIVGLWAGTWADRFRRAEKLTLEQASRMEARYRGLLEAAPDAMMVVNDAGDIVLLNFQAEKQFGYHRDELVGQQVKNIIPEGFAERLIADDLRSTADALAQQIGTGIELVGRRKDDTEFPIEIMLSPLESAEGILVTAAIRDISERKEAEAALRRTTQLTELIYESVADILFLLAVEPGGVYRFESINPAFLAATGMAREQVVGRRIEDVLPESSHALVLGNYRRAIEERRRVGWEEVAVYPTGTKVGEVSVVPVFDHTGRCTHLIGSVHDATERKQLESHLLQVEKLESIGRLAGGIAHDFNNMLFVIHGYAELLTEDLASRNRARLDPDSALLSVNEISHAADRAARLTAQLLAFSHQQVISPRVLDLNTAIGDLEPMVRQLIGENMRLVVKLDPEAGRIRGDAGQFDQILVNLVVNARDAMPDGGTVTIETTNALVDEPYAIAHFDVRPGRYVVLSVTDTGFGMDDATREHIFEPFFTTKEPGKGTGLGLATTYGIVRQAGGHIWVYSEPGIGSSFKLFFPMVDDAMTADLQPVDATIAGATGTVLVVEDERLVRDMTTLLLTRSGYEVIAVADGAEAMVRLANHDEPIDALVTDVIMPNMSGIELAEWTLDRYPHVGVVLLPGYTAETLGPERITARGAMFVPKPVTSGQLLAGIAQARFAASQLDRSDQSPTKSEAPI